MSVKDDPVAFLLPAFPQAEPLSEATLFAFDDWAFPFTYHLQTHLQVYQGGQIVVPTGEEGSHDASISYYGTVIRINDKLHMWYIGSGEEGSFVCYAISDDGVNWEKPNLGLVEYKGSRNNNIVNLPNPGFATATVLYEPEDPDPNRRFKMIYEGRASEWGYGMFAAFSPDGLRWQNLEQNPVGPFIEMLGLTKFRGLYYLNGQDISGSVRGDAFRPMWARRLNTYVSADFEHWSPCCALGLNRSGDDRFGPPDEDSWSDREEIHLGASMWDRGNVILGIYGQWHGHFSGDRGLLTMDLGFAISHDALHWREPIPGFRIIPSREPAGRPNNRFTQTLQQGQGMLNVGDQTLFWYSLWGGDKGRGVRLATWPRDRIGYLKPFYADRPRAITCPIRLLRGKTKVNLNASGLGQYSHLRVGLSDEGFRPISGFSGESALVVKEDGFKIPLRWQAGDSLSPDLGTVRVDVQFEGVRPEDCRLHAVYLEG